MAYCLNRCCKTCCCLRGTLQHCRNDEKDYMLNLFPHTFEESLSRDLRHQLDYSLDRDFGLVFFFDGRSNTPSTFLLVLAAKSSSASLSIWSTSKARSFSAIASPMKIILLTRATAIHLLSFCASSTSSCLVHKKTSL